MVCEYLITAFFIAIKFLQIIDIFQYYEWAKWQIIVKTENTKKLFYWL